MTEQHVPSLIHYLDEGLQTAQDDEEPRAYLGISQLGRCGRANGYALRPDEYPREIQTESLRFWHEGHVAEEDIVARLNAAGCPVFNRQLEVTFPEGHPLAGRVLGHLDGEVPLSPALVVGSASGSHVVGTVAIGPNDEALPLAILEIKSLRQGALKKLATAGTVSEAWPQYGLQAHTYAFCRGRQWVAFLVKDRNDGTIVECWEPYNADLVGEAVAHGLNILAALDRGSLPPRDYNPGSDWQCRKEYCSFRDQCRGDGA
jgi:hypothetical protein